MMTLDQIEALKIITRHAQENIKYLKEGIEYRKDFDEVVSMNSLIIVLRMLVDEQMKMNK